MVLQSGCHERSLGHGFWQILRAIVNEESLLYNRERSQVPFSQKIKHKKILICGFYQLCSHQPHFLSASVGTDSLRSHNWGSEGLNWLFCSTLRKDEGIDIALFASFMCPSFICVRPLHEPESILLNTELSTCALFFRFILLHSKFLDTSV